MSISLKMNILNALLAAGSVLLVFLLNAGVCHDKTSEESGIEFNAELVQIISGLAAALFLGLCIPFCVIANRASPIMLGIFILLIAALFLSKYNSNVLDADHHSL